MAMEDWVVPEEVFARGLNLGQKRERERIIKLLEDFDKENASCQCCFTELCVNDAIALIKGEYNA